MKKLHKKSPCTAAATTAHGYSSQEVSHQNTSILTQSDGICKGIITEPDAGKLRCPHCGAVLERTVSFDGADWDSERGEGSGFDWRIALVCPRPGCGHVFGLGRLRSCGDICEEAALYRRYHAPGTYDERRQPARREAVNHE